MIKVMLRFLLCICAAISLNAAAQETNEPPRHVLFICTGNFYRSRFAAAFFNAKANAAHLNCQADSRGLGLFRSQHGISPYAKRELLKRGVPVSLCGGEPKPLTKKDLEKSDYVVLMDESEHRPLMEKLFPKCDGHKIHYWHIPDTGKMKPAAACEAIAQQVAQLIKENR